MRDAVTRFLIENLDIRGSIVQLDSVWQAICTGRDYPAPVQSVLGEMCAVSAIIATNLKHPARLTFQLSGKGPVSMLVVDCPESLNMRAHARHMLNTSVPKSFSELVGSGQLLMTCDEQGRKQPYQSYVPVEGNTVAEVFCHYLAQSEQQPSWLFLGAGNTLAAGIFLQKLPGADLLDADGWNRVGHLVSTLGREELMTLDANTILGRLFPEEDVRVFDPRPVMHHFPRDREKIATMLRGLGAEEVERILAEHGEVLVRDDLSNHEYRFSAEEARALFGSGSPTLH